MRSHQGVPRIHITAPSPYEDPFCHTRLLYVSERAPDGKIFVAKPLEFVEVEDNVNQRVEPTYEFYGGYEGMDPLTKLMDALWNLGVRPTDIGTPGHLAATQEHLKDMRLIALHAIGIGEKP